MEDAEIIRLYFSREERAIFHTDQKYGALCRRISCNILSSREDAEECVNDTYHKAWNTMPPERPRSLSAYLCRIVRNLSISLFRAKHAKKRGAGTELLLSELSDCLPAKDTAFETLAGKELAGVINRWLDSLSGEDRILFVRRYFYGDGLSLLSRDLFLSRRQLSQKLFRLRSRLRAYLEEKGALL